MIVVAGHLIIDPTHRNDARAAIATGVAATREESGNVDYRFSADLDDADRLNLVELWESEEAMEAHLATPHLATMLEALGPCLKEADVIRYDVSGSSKLF